MTNESKTHHEIADLQVRVAALLEHLRQQGKQAIDQPLAEVIARAEAKKACIVTLKAIEELADAALELDEKLAALRNAADEAHAAREPEDGSEYPGVDDALVDKVGLNAARVLTLLREEGAMPKDHIAKFTGLHPGAVAIATSELLRRGFVDEGFDGEAVTYEAREE